MVVAASNDVLTEVVSAVEDEMLAVLSAAVVVSAAVVMSAVAVPSPGVAELLATPQSPHVDMQFWSKAEICRLEKPWAEAEARQLDSAYTAHGSPTASTNVSLSWHAVPEAVLSTWSALGVDAAAVVNAVLEPAAALAAFSCGVLLSLHPDPSCITISRVVTPVMQTSLSTSQPQFPAQSNTHVTTVHGSLWSTLLLSRCIAVGTAFAG
mmetsp:Transcript_25887/g.67937  ORF Transcript_25887/g.67937 Transcript_25887/m.67937 type:complete len:209 (-) Transcript_25887:379-1005(-)